MTCIHLLYLRELNFIVTDVYTTGVLRVTCKTNTRESVAITRRRRSSTAGKLARRSETTREPENNV